MATKLTPHQKAAETRKRNATTEQVPPVPRVKKETVVITAEQFMAGIKRLTDGFDTLDRLEGLLSAVHRNDAPDAGYSIPRITEVPQGVLGNKASSQSSPVSVLIDDVHSRTSALRGRLESLRDSLVHGIHPDQPRPSESIVQANLASQGPSKDALNWSFSNLAASEALVEEIQHYLLNN